MQAFDPTEFIELNGARIAVRRSDTFPGRPVIVFLHDSLGCISLWRDFPDRLAEQCRCNLLVYDRQGYGASEAFAVTERSTQYMHREAEVLSALTDHFRSGPVWLFGHSDGGSIALIAASLYPEKVQGVITEGAHIFVEDITLQGIREAVEAYRHTDLPQRLQRYHGDRADAVFRLWSETWLRDDFRDWNLSPLLHGITCPVLVLQGVADEYGTEAQVQGIVTGVSGPVSFLMVPRAKHTPHKEAAAETLSISAAFIADHLSGL